MEITFQQYENIQDYLDGKMSPEKQKDFERQLETDLLLKDHLAFEQELREGLELIERKEEQLTSSDLSASDSKFNDPAYIRSLIKTAGSEFDKKKNDEKNNKDTFLSIAPTSTGSRDISKSYLQTVSISYYTGLAVAASLIILVISAIWLLTPAPSSRSIVHNEDTTGKKRNPEIITPVGPGKEIFASLFKQFFRKDKVPAEKPEFLLAALTDYEKGKYGSIQNFNPSKVGNTRGNFVNSKQNVLELGHYYKGLAFIETNNAGEAIKNLQWVIDHAEDQQLVSKSEWYLALTYLRDNEPAKTVVLLDKVTKDAKAAPYDRKAKELLLELNSK